MLSRLFALSLDTNKIVTIGRFLQLVFIYFFQICNDNNSVCSRNIQQQQYEFHLHLRRSLHHLWIFRWSFDWLCHFDGFLSRQSTGFHRLITECMLFSNVFLRMAHINIPFIPFPRPSHKQQRNQWPWSLMAFNIQVAITHENY